MTWTNWTWWFCWIATTFLSRRNTRDGQILSLTMVVLLRMSPGTGWMNKRAKASGARSALLRRKSLPCANRMSTTPTAGSCGNPSLKSTAFLRGQRWRCILFPDNPIRWVPMQLTNSHRGKEGRRDRRSTRKRRVTKDRDSNYKLSKFKKKLRVL